MRIKPSVMVK